MLGALTPTEVVSTWAAGPSAVKVFPAGRHGLDHLRALRDILPAAPLIPSGGISTAAASDYLRTGAVGVGYLAALINGHPAAARLRFAVRADPHAVTVPGDCEALPDLADLTEPSAAENDRR